MNYELCYPPLGAVGPFLSTTKIYRGECQPRIPVGTWTKLVGKSPNEYGLVECSWRHECFQHLSSTRTRYMTPERAIDYPRPEDCKHCAWLGLENFLGIQRTMVAGND